MARTKKQTIDAASARKRQFREEILNHSLVMNAKKRGKLDSSRSETTSAKRDRSKKRSARNFDVAAVASAMSISPKTAEECSILPQAIVRITDIYRSSPDIMSEEYAKKTRDISPRSSQQRENITKNIFEVMEKSVCRKKNRKTSPSPKSKDTEVSLRESDRVRSEKGKKISPEGSPVQNVSPKHVGRRSPRHLSPNSSDAPPRDKSVNNPATGTEKQKINIFTDNIGKDLGKRVRSPRRLSEDMIALPIFSYRKVGQSPKDNSGCYKYADDAAYVGFSNSDNFKSPNSASLASSKKISPRTSPLKSSERTDCDTDCAKTPGSSFNQSDPTSQAEQLDNKSARESSFVENRTKNSPSVAHNSDANKLLMSSICSNVIQEISSKRGDLFKSGNEKKPESRDGPDTLKVNLNESDDVDMEGSQLREGADVDMQPSESEKVTEEEMNVDTSKESNEKNDIKPSLLCAMLVGGADVTDDYTQQRERYNPEVTEISDSETEQSRELSSDSTERCDLMEVKPDIEIGTDNSEVGNSDCVIPESELKVEVKSEPIAEVPDVKENEKMCSESINVELEDSKKKKKNIDFSFQLKKVNEDILKLLDIDNEEEFMEVPNAEEIMKESMSESETMLYKLIFDLGLRLKENANDPDEIDKVLESCPKGYLPIVSTSHCEMKWKNLLDRLEKEKSKVTKSQHKQKKAKLAEDMEHLVEKMSASNLFSIKDANNEKETCEFEDTDNTLPGHNVNNESGSETKDLSLSTVVNEIANEPVNCLMSTSSSSLNGSLCELDLDSMTTAATQALEIPELNTPPTPNSVVDNITCGAAGKCAEDVNKSNPASKRTFQKAKTCADFSIESPSTSSKCGTLRRSNSSPQLKSDALSQVSSSILGKEQQVKSKLGGKIPVPGTSYSSKSTRKSWRKPRLIMDPKPLDVLLQFVKEEKDRGDVFTSQDLQKYLWMPSNRMIVTPQIRNEMNLADKTAGDAWERRVNLMYEEEERQRIKDEEIDLDYMTHEPDFDEVDGMLFMSFSTEVELHAHVRVERALEWDKDDTMLRISRAKTFEETKALNGDMKGVKMKKLRGQHMRWKKYRRMYSTEVHAVLTAKEKNIPLEEVKILGKTCDVSKIKGSKKRSSPKGYIPESKENESANMDFSFSANDTPIFNPLSNSTPECCDAVPSSMKSEVLNKRDLSPRSRRRFNFSDQRAHKQLFKELNMDWEDRMIHRKLGGWSLKGNRPKKFSQAARKRELKKEQVTESSLGSPPDYKPQTISAIGFDSSYDATLAGSKRKKLLFPLLTERMARNCLKTLELSDDISGAVKRSKRKKRSRDNFSNRLPSLTPILSPMATCSFTSTPDSSIATVGSEKMDIFTPKVPPSPSGSAVPTATPPLSLVLPDETVMEGVEIVSQTSSPSLADSFGSPHIKSCSKPGCRYGCICHLCAVNEVQSDVQSPVSKPSPRACDKEYCRLGCICDSLDPEQPVPNQGHCGKPSCMLECNCSNPGSVDGNEDIPFLSSMKQRPRAGERFSNLPRREKTHRMAKNLDAITRKAMMLYETSEIYCEKVERARKKPESILSPTNPLITSPLSTAPSFNLSQSLAVDKSATNNSSNEFVVDLTESGPMESTVFNAVNLVTSEVATVTASHLTGLQWHPHRSQLFPWSSKRMYGDTDVDIEIDEVRLTRPIVEPSTHKRKRKSHPLSDEIFSISTCARIQPYAWQRGRSQKLHSLEKSKPYKQEQDDLPCLAPSVSQDLNLKITDICSLAEDNNSIDNSTDKKVPPQEDNIVDLTLSKANPCTGVRPEKPDFSHSLVSSQFHKMDQIGEAGSKEVNKMQHGWHTSMVCLKAKAAPKAKNLGEDDVQEEDEVKLLEFAANCNWDSAKKDVLSRVASCLTRNQYPQPRMINVGEFVVEILPKAKQPSLIPPALRAKLPGQMYSIRVRITRRDSECEVPVIDLSQSSPVKEVDQKKHSSSNQTHLNNDLTSISSPNQVVKTAPPITPAALEVQPLSSSSLSSASSSTSKDTPSTLSPSTESSLHSSIGISGFNRMCMNSNDSVIKESSSSQSKSAPGSRRSSIESFKESKIPQTVDDALGVKMSSGMAKGQDLGKIQIVSKSHSSSLAPVTRLTTVSASKQSLLSLNSNSPAMTTFTVHSSRGNILVSHQSPRPLNSLKQANNSTSAVTTLSTTTSLNLIKRVNSATSLLTPGVPPNISRNEKLSLKIPSFAVASGKPVSPVIAAKNVNELKYVQMLYEVDGQKEKKKTLIAVPISLAGSTIDVGNKSTLSSTPILTVPMPGAQAKGMPLLAPRNKSKLPHRIQAAPVIMKFPHKNSTSNSDNISLKKPVQLIPLSVSTLSSNKTSISVPSTVSPTVSVPKTQLSSTSCEETIMVFDKAHLSASEFEQHSISKESSTLVPTSSTQSRDRPISSSEISSLPYDLSSKTKDGSCSPAERSDSPSQCKIVSQQSSEIRTSNAESETPLVSGSSGVVEAPVMGKDSSFECQGDDCDDSSQALSSHSQTPQCPVSESELADTNTSRENEPLPPKQHPTSDNQTTGSKENLENVKENLENVKENSESVQPDEGCSNSFEVIDMDDLYIMSMSDDLTTGECIDICSDNCNASSEINEHCASVDMKRKISPSVSEDLDGQGSKKLKLLSDIPIVMDEDSNLSIVTASPQSYTSQAKSCLSSAVSSGSNEDFINNLSSDEEIDVGENISSFQQRMEKAWENDHSSMFCKIPVKKRQRGNGHKGKETFVKTPTDRVEYHNYLERTRRAKMKELFDNLGDSMLTIPGVQAGFKSTDGSTIPKARILNGAKAAILHLEEKARKQPIELQRLSDEKEKLNTQLKDLKVHLLTNNMSGRAIAAIVNKVSRSRREQAALVITEADTEVTPDISDVLSSQMPSTFDDSGACDEQQEAPVVVDTGEMVTCKTESLDDFDVDFYPM